MTARGGGGAESKRKAFLESQPEKVGGGNLQSDLPTDVEEQWPEPVLEGDAIDDVGGLNVGAVGTEAVDKAGAVETSEAVRTFPTRSERTLLTESSARLPWRGGGGRDGQRHGGRGAGRKEIRNGRGMMGGVRRGRGRGTRPGNDAFAGAPSPTKTDGKDPQRFSVPGRCDESTQLASDMNGLERLVPRLIPSD